MRCRSSVATLAYPDIPMSEVATTSNDATPWTFGQFLSDGTVTQETLQGKVLKCLLEVVGEPISPYEISEKIEVRYGTKISRNSMTNVVSQLRKKIADNPHCGYTLTKGSRADPKVRLQINAVLDS